MKDFIFGMFTGAAILALGYTYRDYIKAKIEAEFAKVAKKL